VCLGIRGDRNDLYLQKGGDKLIQDVAKGCGEGMGDVVVVIHAVGPVIVENFIDIMNVKAVIHANLPGTESGNAIVDILFGDVNPSGRLPYTIAKKEEDYGPGSKIKYLPSVSDGLAPQQNFSEGLYIDYRHFDKQDIAPRFEFGYGLSYTQFKLSSLVINSKGKKTPLPAKRPEGIAPPSYSKELPSPESALFPEGFHKVEKYIYPWIESTNGIKRPEIMTSQIQSPLSDAGGGPGGNPDLYTTVLSVTAAVTNTGPVDGSTVVQLYISLPQGYKDHETGEPVDFPIRVLRGFEKIHIEAQNQEHGKGDNRALITFDVTRRDVSYWDAKRQNWVMPTSGEIGISVGFSSRDLPLQGTW
jgi:beta-glucosidase